VHIGLCSPHWPPGNGANGIVSYVAAVRDHFIAQGHDVTVISQRAVYSGDGSATLLSLPEERPGLFGSVLNRMSRRLDRSPGALSDIGRTVAREIQLAHRLKPFDILEMEDSFGWSAIVGRTINVPVVTRLHGPHFLKPVKARDARQKRADRSRCAAEASAVRSARLITAPTKAIMDRTCENSRRDPNKPAAVIPNPIVIPENAPRWELSGCERDHILMVGRFDYWKGADTLLIAFERLLQTRPQARLTIVGPDLGIEVIPEHRIGYDAYARASLSPATRERISFLGMLKPEEIAPLRLKANVTVVSSRLENLPYVLLEGMAIGCPLLCTDWPGSEEIIDDGRTGVLTPVGQPGEMAANLGSMLANPELAAALGAAAHSHCAQTFSVDVVGKQLIDFYDTMLKAAA